MKYHKQYNRTGETKPSSIKTLKKTQIFVQDSPKN